LQENSELEELELEEGVEELEVQEEEEGVELRHPDVQKSPPVAVKQSGPVLEEGVEDELEEEGVELEEVDEVEDGVELEEDVLEELQGVELEVLEEEDGVELEVLEVELEEEEEGVELGHPEEQKSLPDTVIQCSDGCLCSEPSSTSLHWLQLLQSPMTISPSIAFITNSVALPLLDCFLGE
jgi:hypothetical protein